MKIYLDLIFIINFIFDMLLLLTVKIVLKRNIKLYRLILGGLFGGLSIFLLFIKINSFELFLFKLIISILMILITFSYKNIRYTINNILFLYMSSIILGGFLYMLNCSFAYKQEGLIFYHNGLSINFIVLLIMSPIIIYLYIKQSHSLKNKYDAYYKVDIYLKDNKILKLNGFLDTGNKLSDPYLNRPIILIDKRKISNKYLDKYILVPISTINSKSFLKCIEINKVDIIGYKTISDVLLGITSENITMEGIDCILQTKLLEE